MIFVFRSRKHDKQQFDINTSIAVDIFTKQFDEINEKLTQHLEWHKQTKSKGKR